MTTPKVGPGPIDAVNTHVRQQATVRAKNIALVSLGAFLIPCASSAMAADAPESAKDAVESVKDVSPSDFKQLVLNSRQPVLVDFYAVWCRPCQKLAPVVADLSGQYSNKVSFYRIDVDKNAKLAAQYGIEGIPAIKIFKSGQVIVESVGLQSKAEIMTMLDRALH